MFLCVPGDALPGPGPETQRATRVVAVDAGKKPAEVVAVAAAHSINRYALPAVGDVVYGKVVRLHQQYAVLSIVCVAGNVVECNGYNIQGKVMREDIRNHHIDSVVVSDFFRPGELVKAKVISLGDEHAYMLSTSDDNFGVCQQIAGRET